MTSRACRNSCGEYSGSVDVDELCCKKIEPTGLDKHLDYYQQLCRAGQ